MTSTRTECEAVRSRFSACLDGELPPAETARFHGHLRTCGTCRSSWQQFESAVHAVQSLPAAAMSDLGKARLRRAIRSAPAPGRRRLPRATGMATAAVLLLAVGYGVGQQTATQPATPTVNQALPNPTPPLRLRDDRTGGWIELSTLIDGLRRHGAPVAVQPRLRVPLAQAADEVAAQEERVRAALDRQGVDPGSIRFLGPVTVDETLLNGPQVEFWVQEAAAKTAGR